MKTLTIIAKKGKNKQSVYDVLLYDHSGEITSVRALATELEGCSKVLLDSDGVKVFVEFFANGKRAVVDSFMLSEYPKTRSIINPKYAVYTST